jgi:ABC-type glycerol-3-phosphate transport system substrate-binding protein
MSAKESMPVQPMIVDNFFYFEMFAMKQGDVAICGYPSTDGSTASVGSNLAVSVSAQSEDQSACRKFLSILLSDEIQQTISINIPVNKKCARDQFITEIQDVNKSVEKNAGNIFAAPGRKLDPSLADRYIDQLSLATTSSFVYHSISLIIYEEIPAYLEGQKSFEEVAAAINDRAQKVLDERD